MIKTTNKKGAFNEIKNIILIIATLIVILISIIMYIMPQVRKNAEISDCITSIEAHITASDAYLLKDTAIGTKGRITQEMFNIQDELPDIKCNTKLIKSDANNKDEFETEIIKTMVETWDLFRKGEKAFFPNQDDAFCHAHKVIKFKKNYNLRYLYDKMKDIKIQQIFKRYPQDITVSEYFNDHDNEKKFINNTQRDYFFMFFKRYHPKYEDINYPIFSPKQAWEGIKFFFITTKAKAMKRIWESKSELLKKINTDKFSLIYDTKTEDAYYSIVFYQFNIQSEEDPQPYIFTVLMVVPYEEEVFKQLDCIMPIKPETI